MPKLQVVNFYEFVEGAVPMVGHTHAGQVDVCELPAWPKTEAKVYLCGPSGFMKAQCLSLIEAGVPAANLHREVFGPELLDYLL